MSGRRHASGAVLLAVLLGGALGCAGPGGGEEATPGDPRIEVTVFAAASLSTVLEAAATAYAADEPGVRLVLSADSSTALRTQIEQGAPADLFLSADTVNPRALVDGGLADGEAVVFAGNELAIVVPSGNPAGIATAADLARDGVRLIAAGEQVPITRYAVELLERLAAEPGYPSDFVARTEANIVSREDDVRAVAAKVALGEGDAGIVYGTDARADDALETVPLPPGVGVRAAYAGVVIAGSSEAADARAFLTWLVGPRGQAVLSGAGFLPAAP